MFQIPSEIARAAVEKFNTDKLEKIVKEEYFEKGNIHQLHQSHGLAKFDPDVQQFTINGLENFHQHAEIQEYLNNVQQRLPQKSHKIGLYVLNPKCVYYIEVDLNKIDQTWYINGKNFKGIELVAD